MNVNLPKKPKANTKSVVIYTISIISCIIAIIIVGFSYYYGSEELDRIITIGKSDYTKEELEDQNLISKFDDIFQNKLEINSLDTEIKKSDENKDIIYTYYSKTENNGNDYDLNLNIPYININNDKIQKYNEEINETFEKKAENVLQTKNKNIAYTVQYEATIENNILSLIIRSNLKQSSSAQRVIVQTYNYDLKNNKEITLEDVINNKEVTVTNAEEKIKKSISNEQKKVSDLKSLGYTIFERNPDDERYKVKNSKEFFLLNGKIYVIYAYGNDNLTSEMDLVII